MANIVTFPSANTSNSTVLDNNSRTDHASKFNKTSESLDYSNDSQSSYNSAKIAHSILTNAKKLHAQGMIDTASFNQTIHMYSSLANGIRYTEPEPPLAS